MVYVFALLVLCIGVALDVFFAGLWFPRSGAVLAGLIAFMFVLDPRTQANWLQGRDDLLQRYLRDVQNNHTQWGRVLNMAISHGSVPNDRIRKYASQEKELRERKANQIKEMERRERLNAERSRTAQAVSILLGTVVWGFGDIPICLVKVGRIAC